jgi:16S rRNA (guanine(966)-N(2))-methyltransferase RsmD
MRIIAGSLRGRRLESPRWPGLRPSSDRLRETLFNVLGRRCEGARFLDLCAGTGAVGLEALSRGAAHVTFVDTDPRALRLVARNLAGCGVTGGYTILRSPVEDIAERLQGGFDLVFVDPPYDEPRLEAWIAAAAAQVGPEGLLIVEHARARPIPADSGGLTRVRVVRSGDSGLAFFRRPVEGVVGSNDRASDDAAS